MTFFPNISVTVKRYGANGHVSMGRWIQGAIQSTFTLKCSVQPASGNDMQTYAEGRRVKSMYRLIASTELFTSDPQYSMNPAVPTNRDEIVFNNETFEIVHAEKWLSGIIPHYNCIMVRELEGVVPNVAK